MAYFCTVVVTHIIYVTICRHKTYGLGKSCDGFSHLHTTLLVVKERKKNTNVCWKGGSFTSSMQPSACTAHLYGLENM